MPSEEFVRGMLYLSLTVMGVPGNTAVIVAFLLLLHQESRLLAADAIVLHLACANLLVVGIRCLLETLASLHVANIFGDVSCKAVIFIYRTSRALSIWLTFLLSAYQCLSIAPPGSRWTSIHTLVAQYLVFVFLFLWVLNTSMTTAAILFSFGSKNDSSLTNNGINVQFCYVNFPSKQSKEANGAAQMGRDVVPMALMTLASLIILIFLYKHSRQVKGLRSSRSGGGGSSGAEQRAAKVVVVLVTFFTSEYLPAGDLNVTQFLFYFLHSKVTELDVEHTHSCFDLPGMQHCTSARQSVFKMVRRKFTQLWQKLGLFCLDEHSNTC
uniref:Vomeronasal type-1 receptor n=1 Tax=Amphiprion percula TaxID=161767 RepID=A0A3P8U4P6_AMPPE